MKFDDAINGIIAMLFGFTMITLSQNLPEVRHIDFGPGFFPTLVGSGLVLAGSFLLLRRLFASQGKLIGWVRLSRSVEDAPLRGMISIALTLAAIIFYIATVDFFGFLITMPIMLFTLLWWFDRGVTRSVAIAITGTLVMHGFFYQVMSVPLPWGVLERYASSLTW